MLYTLYGEQTNGKICMPATKQEIIDYCINNKDIAEAIFSAIYNSYLDNEYEKWIEDVSKELEVAHNIPYDKAKEFTMDEGEVLYHSGMTNVAEAADELQLMYGSSPHKN